MRTSRTATLALLLVLWAVPASADEPLVEKVKGAIDKGVRFLRVQEGGKGQFEDQVGLHARSQKGGATALVVVALLNAGVAPDDELVERCLKYLRSLPPEKSYTVGLQTMAYCLAGHKQDRQRIQQNVRWMEQTRLPGGWGYDNVLRSPDHSINQYILLGVHEARLAGFQVNKDLLRAMYETYNPAGHPGQWGYRTAIRPSLTMTTAGLCNLLITGEDLRARRALNADGSDPRCGQYDDELTVARAMEYIAAAFPNDIRQAPRFPHPFYCLYGLERAGRLTGRRFFGEHDWYRVGCEYLVDAQKNNGSWEGGNADFDRWPVVSTSLSLLFLSKGRTPVLISKLAHGEVLNPHNVARVMKAEEWNNKRFDARHIVEFCSRELFERKPLAWQVFDARQIQGRTPVQLAEELLQTPIVYVNGHSLTRVLDTKQEDMLREYVSNGGFIFAEACCNAPAFDRQFRQLVKRVTGSDLAPLPSNHPVWTASGKFALDWRDFELEGVQQGCKTVVMYSPKALAGHWENNDTTTEKGKKAFELAANVVAYATGLELPKPRLSEVEIVKESTAPKPPRGYLQVAQLVSSSGAQPLAPKAIPNLMIELSKNRLEVYPTARNLTLTEKRLLDYKLFYMHDRNGFQVPPAEALENLKFTLENGGVLLADAACGSKAFDRSFRELVKRLWPDRKLEDIDVRAAQEKNGLYSKEVNGEVIEEVRYRREEKDGTPSKDFQKGPPRLEGIKIDGRWAVVYSRYDIGCALEKHQSTDCLGHDYESARALARAVVLYALRR